MTTNEQYWNPTLRGLIDGLKNEPEKLTGAISSLISDIIEFDKKSKPTIPKEPGEEDIKSLVFFNMASKFMIPVSKN